MTIKLEHFRIKLEYFNRSHSKLYISGIEHEYCIPEDKFEELYAFFERHSKAAIEKRDEVRNDRINNAPQDQKFSLEQQTKAEECLLDIDFDMVSQFYVRPEGIDDNINSIYKNNFVHFLKDLHYHNKSMHDSADKENVQNLFDYLLEANPETFNDGYSGTKGHSYQEDAILAGVRNKADAYYLKTAYKQIIPYKIEDPIAVIKASSLFAKLENAGMYNFAKVAFEKEAEKYTKYNNVKNVKKILELYKALEVEHQEQVKDFVHNTFLNFVKSVSNIATKFNFDKTLKLYNSFGPEFQDDLKDSVLTKLSDIRKSVSKMNKRHNKEGNSEENIPLAKLDKIRKFIDEDSYNGQTLEVLLVPQKSFNEEVHLAGEEAAVPAVLHDSLEA